MDWDEQYDKLLAERKRIPEHGSIKDLPAFDIIVGRDLFVAIEDLAERILKVSWMGARNPPRKMPGNPRLFTSNCWNMMHF